MASQMHPAGESKQKEETTSERKDKVYAKKRTRIPHFEFNKDVVDVFPDMIERSVPGYKAVLEMTKVVAHEFVKPGTVVYDLGCSLGATTQAMINGLEAKREGDSVTIVAVDNAPAMIDQCRKDLASTPEHIDLNLRLGDILEQPIVDASLVALNYTLQFIPLEQRLALLTRIHDGLVPGGVLMLSEKVVFSTDTHQHVLTDLHHAFKRMNGYSDLEISQKRTALEHVLIPESIMDHQQRLDKAGFSVNMVWFQSVNFVSILAIK